MSLTRIQIRSTYFLALTLLAPLFALAETDQGSTSFKPFSGPWWPLNEGGLSTAYMPYDKLLGTEAEKWERQNKASPSLPDWFGYCHAWSASSVCEKEPKKRRDVRQVRFTVGDQKGLLAACHAQDLANSYGDRFSEGEGSEAQADMLPDEVWRVLQLYVKQQRIPLIMDLECGPQVWNYPVYQYQIEYQPGSGGWYEGTMELVAADDNVGREYLGTEPALFSYTFRVRFEDGAVVAGSGQWTGDSVGDHPDFAWYPYVAVAENPEVEIAEVSKIVGYEVGGSNPPPGDDGDDISAGDDDTPPPPPPPPPPPGDDSDQSQGPTRMPGVLSPDELLALVMNKKSAFELDAFLDLGDGGKYRAGDPIRVSWRSAQEGYLYLFDIGPDGSIRLVFPLAGQPNRIKGNALYDLPGKDAMPWFMALAPGQHDVKAIVTKTPVKLTGFTELPAPALPEPAVSPEQLGKLKPQTKERGTPQKIVLCPSATKRVSGRLVGFRKGGQQEEEAAPKKAGTFAQDMCSYFVMPAPDTKKK